MKRLLPTVAIAFLAGNLHAAQVTHVIDPFTTFQIVATNNATVTNTVAATNTVGGFRTMILTSTGGSTNVNTIFGVDNAAKELILNTPANATPRFNILWGGAGGTSGLGGYDFGSGQPLDLLTSILSFTLTSTDQANDFTWTFTDTNSISATYTGTFPALAATNPPLPFNIALSLFTNAGGINWNAINFISFSGGDASGVDMTAAAPFQVIATTVPEPSTWALLTTGLLLITFVARRKAKSRA